MVCPTSLKYQWQSEILRFTGRQGENAARVINGGRAQRQKDYALDDFCKITNYEKLKPDLDLIAAWAPELVIVDEAQRVKNWNTIAARALKRIDSPYAIVLTGTPLENKLEELISIVQFVDQHRLGPTWKLLHEHQVKDEAGRVTGYTGLEKIGQTLAPIMIRRRKSEVLQQLPGRTDQNLLVPMTEMQMLYHQENADVVAKIVQRWRKNEVPVRQGSAAADLRAAEHAHVVQQHLSAGPGNRSWRQGGRTGGAVRRICSPSPRPRWWCFRSGRGPTTSSSAVSKRVSSATSASTAACRRTNGRRWSSGFVTIPTCRVFLSTDAGSTGLNLQHASTLVNMDLPWNPAMLEQRIARIHRMGQTRPVRVINFVAKGTIEEGMLSVLAFKRSLSAGILDGGSSEISLGGSRLNRFMKDVENVTGRMGEGEAVTPAEEVRNIVTADDAGSGEDANADVNIGAGEMAIARADGAGASPRDVGPDPWQALVQVGAQFVAALAAANDPNAPAHPWVERDPATGAQNLKMPLPPPETARQLANALSALADSLRGKIA